jgi:simple sugar transport system permease protein
VILSGGIDLSVGSVVAFTSILVATLVTEHNVSPLMAMALGLLIGALFGAAMGCLIQWFELPPFLVTLAGMFFLRGIGFVVHPQSLGIKHSFFQQTITQSLSIPLNARVSWPFTATCFVVVFLVAIVVAHYTKFGRYIYALGGDESSARLMGLPMARTKVLIYTVSGFCSALAGIVYVFYFQSGDPASCVGLELDAIAAVVIGGTVLTGGAGFMAGTLMGVLILGLIQTLITFNGHLNSWWTRIVVGMLMLLFILLQNLVSLASGRMTSKK